MESVIQALRKALVELVQPSDHVLALAPLGIPFDPNSVEISDASPETLGRELFSDLIDSAALALPGNGSLSDWYAAALRASIFHVDTNVNEEENGARAAIFEQLKATGLSRVAASELSSCRPPFQNKFLRVEANPANWYELNTPYWGVKVTASEEGSPEGSNTPLVAPWVHRKLWMLELPPPPDPPPHEVELPSSVWRLIARNLGHRGHTVEAGDTERLSVAAREVLDVDLRVTSVESARAFGLTHNQERAPVWQSQRRLNYDLPAWAAIRDQAFVRSPTVEGASERYEVRFGHLCVYGSRDWLYEPFLHSKHWQMAGYPSGSLSNGSPNDPRGPIALFPIALLLVKDVIISANWSSADLSTIEHAVGFGPFSLSGRRFESQTLQIPGMQILGWLCQSMVTVPPN